MKTSALERIWTLCFFVLHVFVILHYKMFFDCSVLLILLLIQTLAYMVVFIFLFANSKLVFVVDYHFWKWILSHKWIHGSGTESNVTLKVTRVGHFS